MSGDDSLRREIDRLRAELEVERAARWRHESRFRQLSASMPAVIWMSDTRNRLTFISDHWYDFTGTGHDALRDWSQAVPPEHAETVLAEIRRRTRRRERIATEMPVVTADGGTVWTLLLGAPRFTDDGKFDGYVGTLVDISERLAAVEARRQAEERLSLALDNTSVGVWDWDVRSGDVWLSDGALAIQGFGPGEVKGDANRMHEIVHPDDAPALASLIRACLKGDTPLINIEHRLTRKGGGWVWVSERARVIERDAEGRALRMIGTRTDMTARRERDERLQWLAAHDVLTRLPNRARFQEILLAAMREADARGSPMGLLLLDIDWFKAVNDKYGHDAGDALLKAIANRLTATFPAPAAVARLGGDEFAVVLPDVRTLAALGDLADKAAAGGASDDRRFDSSASVGAALYPDHAGNAVDLMKRADIALYRAKDRGRARAVIYTPER